MFTLTMKNTPALQTNSITEDHHRKTCWCIRVGEAPEVSSRATPPPSWTAAEEEAKHILRYFRSVTQSSRSSLITVIFVIIDIILGFCGEGARVSRISPGGTKSLIHRYFEKKNSCSRIRYDRYSCCQHHLQLRIFHHHHHGDAKCYWQTSVLREWILKVREVKMKKILFHFLFEK